MCYDKVLLHLGETLRRLFKTSIFPDITGCSDV